MCRETGFPLGNALWRFILDNRQSFGDQMRWKASLASFSDNYGSRVEFKEYQNRQLVMTAPPEGASYTWELGILVNALRWGPKEYSSGREEFALACQKFYGKVFDISELQKKIGEFHLASPKGVPTLVFLEHRSNGRSFFRNFVSLENL